MVQEGKQASLVGLGELDMFADEINPEDFAAAVAPARGAGAAHAAGLADSFDDIEGYYSFTVRSPLLAHWLAMHQIPILSVMDRVLKADKGY